ncbi:hypothetical protein E2C01_075625 [Portunus trituberculatus]|uniref:Uncharacterized protein n=1 Tax=Portunus trituberculatus TaxID=210409 RepID=A0A5B7IFI5_PORTR|nr:hypothetical protein [Portunus trituberculatus]
MATSALRAGGQVAVGRRPWVLAGLRRGVRKTPLLTRKLFGNALQDRKSVYHSHISSRSSCRCVRACRHHHNPPRPCQLSLIASLSVFVLVFHPIILHLGNDSVRLIMSLSVILFLLSQMEKVYTHKH